jgi:enoyl-CoA hydratase/carnithine racemase
MSVDLRVESAVAKVVLNRPDKLNALTVDMRQSLCDCFARLRFDDAVRVVIVIGAGRGFCSGADVDRMAGQPHDLRATAIGCSVVVTPLSGRSIRSRSR